MSVASGFRELDSIEIAKLSSAYLQEGKARDVWKIVRVAIDGKHLRAQVQMDSYYTSSADSGGFHLSQLCALEFLSQLKIIFVHLLAGYTEKTQEGWMLETSINCKSTIRNPQNIQVEMAAISVKKVKNSVLIITHSRVFDESGLFEARLKGILS